MKKYIATFQSESRSGTDSFEHEIQASSLKHAKKLAKDKLNKYPFGSTRLVDVRKAN